MESSTSTEKPWYIQELIERRQRLGLSQRALAKLLGFGQGQLSEYESGKVGIKIDVLAWWASALDLTLTLEFESNRSSNKPVETLTSDLNDSLTHPLTDLTAN